MNHAERIQEFHLRFPEDYNDRILSQLTSRAPRLQHLRVSVRNASSSRPLVLFDGNTPALRTLELSGCPVLWSSFKPNALTTLRLYHVPEGIQQNTEEFLAALRHMQNLEHLYLDNALARAPGFLSGAAGEMRINLPYLSRLLIAAPLSTVIALLFCVNNPSKTQLRLRCFPGNDTSLDDFTRLYSVLAQRFSQSEDQAVPISTIRSLSIRSADRWSSAELTFSALERDCDCNSIPISHLDWGSNIPLRISFELDPPMTTSEGNHIMSEICAFMPLANVHSAHVIHPPFSPAFWRKLLGRLQELRYLKVSFGMMPDLASVLSLADIDTHKGWENQVEHADGDRGTDHVLAPDLDELNLYYITFPQTDDPNLPGITEYRLFDALSTRDATRGRVTMTRCKIDINGLRRFDMVRLWGGETCSVEWHSD